MYLFLAGMLATPLLLAPGRSCWPPILVGLVLLPLGEHARQRTGGAMMTHPTSTPMLVYTLGLLGVSYVICRLLQWMPPIRLLGWSGGRSLDIFLYHYLFLLPFLSFRDPATACELPFAHGQAAIVAVAIPTAVIGALGAARLSRLQWWWPVQTFASASRT